MREPFRPSELYHAATSAAGDQGKSLPQLLLSVIRRRVRGARRKLALRLRRALVAQLEGRPKAPEVKVPERPVRVDRRV